MESVDILIDYFSLFNIAEEHENKDKKNLSEISKVLNILNNVKSRVGKVQYIKDFKFVIKLVSEYEINIYLDDYLKSQYNIEKDIPNNKKDLVTNINKGNDYILYDLMLNINRYNLYLMNKKVRTQNFPISANINFETMDLKLKNILDYLEIKELDSNLIDDLSKYANLDKLKELATVIKTDNGMKRILFDKIEDKNVLMAILLHSNLNIINNIINIFDKEKSNINKVVSNIPSIFIQNYISNKCKYNTILTNYDNFIENYNYLKDNNIEFKKMLNFPVYFINDSEKNKKIIDKLNILVEG